MRVSSRGPREAIRTLCDLAGENDPRQAAVTMARRTLEGLGRIDMPIDVRELCKLRKMRVYEHYLPDCDARLIPMREGYIVEIQKGQCLQRQNFSLCHEIGHTFFAGDSAELLAREYSCNVFDAKTDFYEERLCSVAATELLMPSDAFLGIASDLVPGLPSVETIANKFGTSTEASIHRILELDAWQCCVLCYGRQDAGCSYQDMRLEWWSPSRALGGNHLAMMGLIFELQRIIEGGREGFSLQRRLGITGERVSLSMPGFGRPVFIEGYRSGFNSFERFYVFVFLGGSDGEKNRNSELLLHTDDKALELV